MEYKEEVISHEAKMVSMGAEAPMSLIKTITYVPRIYNEHVRVNDYNGRELRSARERVLRHLADMLTVGLKYYESTDEAIGVKSYCFSVSILMDKEKNDLLETINSLERELQISGHKVGNYKNESLWAMIKRWYNR